MSEYRQIPRRVRATRWTGRNSHEVEQALRRVDDWSVTEVGGGQLLLENAMRDEALLVEHGHWVVVYEVDGDVETWDNLEFGANFEQRGERASANARDESWIDVKRSAGVALAEPPVIAHEFRLLDEDGVELPWHVAFNPHSRVSITVESVQLMPGAHAGRHTLVIWLRSSETPPHPSPGRDAGSVGAEVER